MSTPETATSVMAPPTPPEAPRADWYWNMKEIRSPSIAKLAAALAKAQLGFTPILKSVENTFYTTEKKKAMYADLAAVIAATQKALAENELVVIQSPVVRTETKEAGVQSLLVHSSGEWLSNEVLLPATARAKEWKDGVQVPYVKFDAQTCGIAITYSRRYSYQSLIGVAAEEDDDANSIGEAAGGSRDAQKAVAAKKVAESNAPRPSLFYVYHEESRMSELVVGEEIKKTVWPDIKKFWDGAVKACMLNDEQLEGLKYTMEQRGIPFSRLKEK